MSQLCVLNISTSLPLKMCLHPLYLCVSRVVPSTTSPLSQTVRARVQHALFFLCVRHREAISFGRA